MKEYKVNEDTELRNKIYEFTRNEIIKCLKIASRSPLSDGELLSLSWDVFLLCIKKFEPREDYKKLLVNAVHTVINRQYAQQRKKSSKEVNVGYSEYPEVTNEGGIVIMDSLSMLNDFRETLPRKYKIVLDDCLLSMGNDIKGHKSRVDLTGLSKKRYYDAKKLMKYFLQHTFGIKEKKNDKPKRARKQFREKDGSKFKCLVRREG